MSENVGIEDLRAIALDLSGRVRGWSGAKRFINELDQNKLLALVSWLWLYAGLNHKDIHVKGTALARYAKANPFENVSNPVGKMIAQTRIGNMAPLHTEDRAELLEYFKELREDCGAVARPNETQSTEETLEIMRIVNRQLDEEHKQRQRGGT